ncbi:MAG: hypothetical protein CM1200mP36_00930 [Gammaproteobacteria bacterium]|nr:MAG: hypothetical protein CM1200mP36_00930 [Gammaproteobacteria bacterium]
MFVILPMVIAVAVFNIVSTLVMVVRDKRVILRSCRALVRPREVFSRCSGRRARSSVLSGPWSAWRLGALVPTQRGAIVAFSENVFGIDLLAEEVYLISDLPTQVRLPEVAQIGGLAIFLAILATLYPAISASRQPPVEALRHE